MSIIIRLQNLPLSAKSGDIRRFFGGLRIPNGGVHIVGGEKGEAFIEFSSEAEARQAMKIDGDKIKNCEIRLFLSCLSEMRHEIAQITGDLDFDDDSHESSERSRSPRHYNKPSSDGRRRTKDNRSDSSSRTGVIPRNAKSLSLSARRSRSEHYRQSASPRRSRSPQRSRSPRGYQSRRSRSPKKQTRSPRRSRSPKKQTRSPRRSRSPKKQTRSPRRSRSPRNRTRSPRRSRSPRSRTRYSRSPRRTTRSPRRITDSPLSDISSIVSPKSLSPHRSDYLDASNLSADFGQRNNISIEQAQLERKIAEALERGYALDTPSIPQDPLLQAAAEIFNPGANVTHVQNNFEQFPNLNIGLSFPGPVPQPFFPENNVASNTMPQFPPFGNNFQPSFVPSNNFPVTPNQVGFPPPNHMGMPEMPNLTMPPPPISHSQAIPQAPPQPTVSLPPPQVQMDSGNSDVPSMPRGFYITLTGLDPQWNSEQVQKLLKGLFVPMNHVQFEQDAQGIRTGTAFVKLSNADDFLTALSNQSYVYMGKIVKVSECPDHVYQRYFLPDWSVQDPKSVNLYYRVNGLPYYATVESMINFFKGLNIADLYIEQNNFGSASGKCWVSFKSVKDYLEAIKLEGAPIGHRFARFKHTTKEEMIKNKRRNGDLLSMAKEKSSIPNISADTPSPKPTSRSLCAMLTGLPPDVTPRKVSQFFKNAGLVPDSIHVSLNNKNRPCGQAFAEFSGIRDFDSALLCHGSKLGNNIICVKQVLYEEMSKILSSKRAMHFYGSSGNAPAPLNLPEKVPYMWEPPDGIQDPSSPLQEEDNYNFPHVQACDSGDKPLNSQPELSNANLGQGIPYKDMLVHDHTTNQNSKNPYCNLTVIPTSGDRMEPSRPKSRSRPRPRRRRFKEQYNLPERDSSAKKDSAQPKEQNKQEKADVKMENKETDSQSKQDKVTVKVELKDTDSKKDVIEKKNSKSQNNANAPVTNDLPKPVSVKSEKKTPEPENDMKQETKARDLPSALSEKNKKQIDHYSDRSNRRNESSSRRVENRDYNSQRQRPYVSSSSGHDEHATPNSDGSDGPAVVQICNVHPAIGSQEINRFLKGYRIDGDQIVRGYTDNQEPTGDVRVTFKSIHEAKLAIRTLNNQLLEGIAVTLFLV